MESRESLAFLAQKEVLVLPTPSWLLRLLQLAQLLLHHYLRRATLGEIRPDRKEEE